MSPLLAFALAAAISGPVAPEAVLAAPLLTQAARLAADARPPMAGSSAARPAWRGDSLENGSIAGAIVGAIVAGGAGIDALFVRAPVARVRVRF